MTNEQYREMSGSVFSEHKLDQFFYLLLRDHLPAGRVEQIVLEVEKIGRADFTNGHLAKIAMNLTDRLESK